MLSHSEWNLAITGSLASQLVPGADIAGGLPHPLTPTWALGIWVLLLTLDLSHLPSTKLHLLNAIDLISFPLFQLCILVCSYKHIPPYKDEKHIFFSSSFSLYIYIFHYVSHIIVFDPCQLHLSMGCVVCTLFFFFHCPTTIHQLVHLCSVTPNNTLTSVPECA